MKSAAFSPDGSRIVTASADKTARIWDAATGKEIAVLRGHEDTVLFRRLQPRRLAHRHGVGGQDRPHLGRRERQGDRGPRGTSDTVSSAAFSPDGSRIVTASEDKTARIWDAATAARSRCCAGTGATCGSPPSAPTASRIVTASEDKTARIWDARIATMSTKELVAEACLRLRGLTRLSRDEMRLVGYAEDATEIDVCAGVE